MATPTNQEIITLLFAIAPQFKTDDPETLASYYLILDQLRCMYNEKMWCCAGAMAFANLLAHYLTMMKNPAYGIASSLTEGGLSISYANTGSEGFLSMSSYGKAFEQILGQFTGGPVVTNGPRRMAGTLAWGPFYGTPFGPCC